MSDIRDFSPDQNNVFHGWATNTLSLKTLENNSSHNITFSVGVNILKIYFKSEVGKGSDINLIHKQRPLIYEKPFKMKSKVSYKWNINQFQFKSFLSAPNKKCWESEQFDQWVLGCYPNGHSKTDQGIFIFDAHSPCLTTSLYTGNAMLYLKILGLPPSIYGVKIRYTLYCPQIDLKWSYVQNYNYANTNYANATFETATLHSLKSLSFEITITVLKLFDLNRKEVEFKDCKKYLHLQTAKEAKTKQANGSLPTNSEMPLFDIYGTMESIKQKLFAAATKDQNGENEEGANEQISAVQEQVNIYSKELQSLNRSIHSTRKGFESLESKISKSTEAFQTVLKQVKIIKDEVDAIKNEQNKINEEENCDNDDDDNKVSNADDAEIDMYHKDKMMETIESQNGLIEAMKVEMEEMKSSIVQLKEELSEERELNKQRDKSEEIVKIKDEMAQFKQDYNGMNEKLNEELKNVQSEIKETNSKFVDYQLEKDANDKHEDLREEVLSLKSMLKELREEMTRQSSIFEQNNNLSKEDNKESDEDQKKKHLKIREWVVNSLEFGKNDLDSIYNKLINDGFDDISLLSELNDDTLKSMGIHKRGDRIKILRACKAIKI